MLPDVLVGSLAESLGRVFAHYDQKERQFLDDVFDIWADLEGLTGSLIDRFRWLYYDKRLQRFPAYNPDSRQRRRPTPFEATTETCRRLIGVNRVRDALANLPTAGILGGSVSYGRFFNVCGASTGKPSDVDILLVLPSYDFLPRLAEALNKIPDIARRSLASFSKRASSFGKIRQQHRPCIFSHKIKVWEDRPDPYLSRFQIPSHYLLSMHVFSRTEFEFMILKDKPILEVGRRAQFLRELYDYRDTRATRQDNQRSFSGIDSTVPLISRQINGGFLSRVRVCHITQDRFYPGLHQNLVLPQFEIRWEAPANRLYLPVLGFRWKVLERLSEERRLRPFEVQMLSLSHTRSAVFAPHIVRRANRE